LSRVDDENNKKLNAKAPYISIPKVTTMIVKLVVSTDAIRLSVPSMIDSFHSQNLVKSVTGHVDIVDTRSFGSRRWLGGARGRRLGA
jgi:hypothetical protein